MTLKIDVLGTEYTVDVVKESADARLRDCDGFCDKTAKRILVDDCTTSCDLECPGEYVKKVLRHELVHAFLFESGLSECWQHPKTGQEETVVDWIAYQFPKLLKAFQAAGAL